MIREAELEEMERKWREENERIMREHPMLPEPAATSENPSAEPAPADHPFPAPPPAHEEPQLPFGNPETPRDLP